MTEERSFARVEPFGDFWNVVLGDGGFSFDRYTKAEAEAVCCDINTALNAAHSSALASKDAQIASMRRALEGMIGQVRQAQEGFGRYQSQSMDAALKDADEALSLSPERAAGEVEPIFWNNVTEFEMCDCRHYGTAHMGDRTCGVSTCNCKRFKYLKTGGPDAR